MKPLVYKTIGGPLSEQRHSATATAPQRHSATATAPHCHSATATAPQPQRQSHSATHSHSATTTVPKPQRHSKSRGLPEKRSEELVVYSVNVKSLPGLACCPVVRINTGSPA